MPQGKPGAEEALLDRFAIVDLPTTAGARLWIATHILPHEDDGFSRRAH